MRKSVASFPYWLPVLLWMGVIFFLSALPESTTPGRDIVPDKVLHAAEYFILAFLILFALQRTTRQGFATSFWITLGLGAVYALSDEIHQLYVPTRHFQVGDLVADVGGVAALFFILWVLQRLGERGIKMYRLLMGEGK